MTREISFPEQERESDARREGSGVGKKGERKKEVGEVAKEAYPSVDHLTALPSGASNAALCIKSRRGVTARHCANTSNPNSMPK